VFKPDSIALTGQEFSLGPCRDQEQFSVIELLAKIGSPESNDTISKGIATVSEPVQHALCNAGSEQAASANAFQIDDHGLPVAEQEILEYGIEVIQTEPGLLGPNRIGLPGQLPASRFIDNPNLLEEHQIIAELRVQRGLVQIKTGGLATVKRGKQPGQSIEMLVLIGLQRPPLDELRPQLVLVLVDEPGQGYRCAAGLYSLDHGGGLGAVAKDHAFESLPIDMHEVHPLGFADASCKS